MTSASSSNTQSIKQTPLPEVVLCASKSYVESKNVVLCRFRESNEDLYLIDFNTKNALIFHSGYIYFTKLQKHSRAKQILR